MKDDLLPPRRRDARWLTRFTAFLVALAVVVGVTLPYLTQRAVIHDKNEQLAVVRQQRDQAVDRGNKAEVRLVAVVCDDIEPLKKVASLFAALIVASPSASEGQKEAAAPFATPAPRPKDCPPPA